MEINEIVLGKYLLNARTDFILLAERKFKYMEKTSIK